jgi:hypothetical protein
MARFDRGNMESTINAARKLMAIDGQSRYVVATANGYAIDTRPVPFQKCAKVSLAGVEIVGGLPVGA